MNNAPDTPSHPGLRPVAGRPLSALAERVLVIGLDGATFDVLDPMMEAGHMPRLKQAVATGAAGPLRSTVPPITPAAWTTFLTGKLPGTHGIIDFERYDPTTNKLHLNSTRALDHVRNLWQILSDHGQKVGSINVPMTYPAIPVNGCMISGFETPGPDSDFAYPPELKADILQRWPDPTSRSKWKRKTLGGLQLFSENVDYMVNSFHQGVAMTRYCGERFGWDALMVVLKLVDNLQHKTWKHIDPRWCDRNPRRRDVVAGAFAQLDKAVGDLLDYADERQATVLMVSDHGHGSLEGKIHVNRLLANWGYLALGSGGAQSRTRAKKAIDRTLGRKKKFVKESDILEDLAVDFSGTRACVMHAGMAGFLYINLKGRQPTGIVEPDDYQALRDELRSRLLGPDCRCEDPSGKTFQLFTAVDKPEELYNCTREDQPWLPDLILTPHDSLSVVRKIRGTQPVRWLPYNKLEGTHRRDGIIIATGAGAAPGRRVEADIVDCTPTILSALGFRIPDDMEGKVRTELFATPPRVETEAAKTTTKSTAGNDDVYSDDDLDKVTERLRDLGYLG